VRIKSILMCAGLLACGATALDLRAQQAATVQDNGGERRVSLEEQPVALDSMGRTALAAQLLTRALGGTPDATAKNARFIIENRSPFFYNYVSGSVTFYDERGVRCGEGQFTLNALAPQEQAETDAPGLRLTCTPRTWRLIANNLLTRRSETASPAAESVQVIQPAPTVPPLEVVVDDKIYDAPLGKPLIIDVRKRRIKITVRTAQ